MYTGEPWKHWFILHQVRARGHLYLSYWHLLPGFSFEVSKSMCGRFPWNCLDTYVLVITPPQVIWCVYTSQITKRGCYEWFIAWLQVVPGTQPHGRTLFLVGGQLDRLQCQWERGLGCCITRESAPRRVTRLSKKAVAPSSSASARGSGCCTTRTP